MSRRVGKSAKSSSKQVWYSPRMPERSAQVAAEARSSSRSSSNLPQQVYNQSTGEYVNLSTHKIVMQNGNQVTIRRDTPDKSSRSGYASPTSNVVHKTAEALNKDIATTKFIPMTATLEYQRALKRQELIDKEASKFMRTSKGFEKSARAAAYREIKAKAKKAQAQGYHTIIKHTPKGYELSYTIPQKKAQAMQRGALIDIGKESYEAHPYLSSFEMAFRKPEKFVYHKITSKSKEKLAENMFYERGLHLLKQDLRTEKYGVLGHGLSALESPVITFYGLMGAGALMGAASGATFIAKATGIGGKKLAALSAASLLGKSTLAGIGGYAVGKTTEIALNKDIRLFSKTKTSDLGLTGSQRVTYFTQLGAGILGAGIGFKAGYHGVVDPYFSVKSMKQYGGAREQGLVYDKKGLVGSSSKHGKVVYKQYKGKQFKADTFSQETYRLKELMSLGDKKLYSRGSTIAVENQLLGYNIAKGTSKVTKLPSQKLTGYGLWSVDKVMRVPTGKTYYTDYGVFKGGETIFSGRGVTVTKGKRHLSLDTKEYFSFSDPKGVGFTASEGITATAKGKVTEITGIHTDITKFKPMGSSPFGKEVTQFQDYLYLGKKGQMSLTGQLKPQTHIPKVDSLLGVDKLTSPKLSTIPKTTPVFAAPSLLWGAALGIGSVKIAGDMFRTDTRDFVFQESKSFDFQQPKVYEKGVGGVGTALKEAIGQRQVVAPKQAQKQAQKQIPTTGLQVTPTQPFVGLPILPFGEPMIGGRKLRGGRSRKKLQFKFGYMPSFKSAILGLTSTKKRKKKYYSGFETRPLIVKRKKPKRKVSKRKVSKAKR